MLVELLVSILQHPLRAHAPAPTNPTDASSKTSSSTPDKSAFVHPLGQLPHQIRGFLSTFSNLSIRGQPYDCCSACSDRIVERYRNEGWDFVKRALNEKGWVEEVSGLKEVQRRAEEMAEEVEWDEDEGDDGSGEGELI